MGGQLDEYFINAATDVAYKVRVIENILHKGRPRAFSNSLKSNLQHSCFNNEILILLII